MDPLSALGLASAVVAIVDFSWKLITGAWEIHRSLEGVTAENAHLEDVTSRLESLMQDLTADVPIKTEAERNILRLSKECKQDAEVLRALLIGMKVPGRRRSPWRSLNAKWKSILNKREIAELKDRIQESRDHIQEYTILMLKEDQSSIGRQLMKIKQDCHDLKTDQPRQLNELKAELLNSSRQNLRNIQRQLQDMQRSVITISIQHRILRHLLPDEIESRHDQILEADPETCRWILEPTAPHPRQDHRQEIHEEFISWLRTGNDVVHISGNPGSGKSTLMKFIAGNPRTQEALRVWAGSKQLIFAQFYLCTAGTEAQRTLAGMLGSLLFQVLSQQPDLVEAVFPNQVNHLRTSQTNSDHCVESFLDFRSKRIQEAFDLLLIHIANSKYKVFFLIDGLDELEGGDLDHEDLAERLKSWATGGDVKLLVSSRPWRPFLTTFTTYRTLHLHELNYTDIKKYTVNQLCQDREIQRIGVDSMMITIEDVVEELSRQAQGIFLWAHLVLDSIRLGIRRQYSARLLKAKIREYPSGLDDLYDALRSPIERSPIDKALSNRMLLLATAVPKHFKLFTLAFSWLPEEGESGLLDPNFPHSTIYQPYSRQDFEKRLKCAAERINGLTRGLLELTKLPIGLRPEVKFCHRTARDYLITNVKRYSELEESWPGFHQSDPYGRIFLADLIYAGERGDPYCLSKSFCRDFKFETIRKFEEPLRPFNSHVYGKDVLPHYYSHDETVRFDFLRCAASCGLDLFMLYETAEYFGSCLHLPEVIILLGESLRYALRQTNHTWDYQLALGLLQSILDGDIVAQVVGGARRYPVHRSTKLPVWIIGLILGLQSILKAYSGRGENWSMNMQWKKDRQLVEPSLVKACHLLNELAVKLGQRLSITMEMEMIHDLDPSGFLSLGNRRKRTFSAVRLLQWAESLDPHVTAINLLGSEVTEKGASSGWLPVTEEQRISGEVLDTAHTRRGENLAGAYFQAFPIVSWYLDSTSGSVEGTTEFHTDDLLDLE